jgi:hypothetical protein
MSWKKPATVPKTKTKPKSEVVIATSKKQINKKKVLADIEEISECIAFIKIVSGWKTFAKNTKKTNMAKVLDYLEKNRDSLFKSL